MLGAGGPGDALLDFHDLPARPLTGLVEALELAIDRLRRDAEPDVEGVLPEH